MSGTIDNRIVEMQFRNQQFEAGINESVGSLTKLKKSLDLEGAVKGLTELQRTSRRVSFGPLGDKIDTLASRFTNFGIVGLTVLQNLTNRAIDSGIAIAKSLTVDNLTAGFARYEQKTAAVQTILNATGLTLEEVNRELDKLAWFSDETSYSFADMVTNIGKFTGAGIELGVAAEAMQGIATWAAISGQNATEASRIMYIMANAISQGNVRLMQWRSIENANMATKEFRETVIRTAIELGTLSKQAKTAEGTLVTFENFSTTLHEDWFTSAVLLRALNKYGAYASEVYRVATEEGLTAAQAMERLNRSTTDLGVRAFLAAQQAKSFSEAINATRDAVSSGWMRTSEIIFGDYHEAIKLWSEVTDGLWELFASGAAARNEMLQAWKDLGGRTDLIEGLKNVINFLDRIRLVAIEAFQEVFPPMTAERLHALTKQFREFTASFKIGEETLNNLRRVFKGFFAFLGVIGQVAVAISFINDVLFLSAVSGNRGDGLLGYLARVGDRMVAFHDWVRESGVLYKGLKKLGEGVDWLLSRVIAAIGPIQEFFASFQAPNIDGILKFFRSFQTAVVETNEVLDPVKSRFGQLLEFLQTVLTWIWNFVQQIGQAFLRMSSRIGQALGSPSFERIFDVFNLFITAGLIWQFKRFNEAMVVVAEGLATVGGALEAWQANLRARTLMTIALSIAILTGALLLLSMVDSSKLAGSLASIGVMMGQLMGAFLIFQKFSMNKWMIGASISLILMATALLVLARVMTRLSKLDPSALISGILTIGSLVAILVIAAKVLSANQGAMIKGATTFVIFAWAIQALTSAITRLAKIKPEAIGQALGALGILMVQLVIFTRAMAGISLRPSQVVGFIAVAIALGMMTSIVERFSKLQPEPLLRGVMALGYIMTLLVLFVHSLPSETRLFGMAAGMMFLAMAFVILGSAIKKIGMLKPAQLAIGLTGITVGLMVLALALHNMPADAIRKSIGVLILAGALLLIARVMQTLGRMSWEAVAKGVVALGGAMAAIVVTMQKLAFGVKGAAALLLVSISLAILARVLTTFGRLPLGAIIQGFASLAGMFTLLAVAGAVLGPMTPLLIKVAGAIFLLGIATLVTGAGVFLLATALATLAISGIAGATALVTVILMLVGTIPAIFRAFGAGILSIATVLTEGIPIIGALIKTFVLEVLEVITSTAPAIVATSILVGQLFMEGLLQTIPNIVRTGLQLITSVLQGIRDSMYQMVLVGVDLVLEFLRGVNARMGDIVDMGFKVLISFLNGLADAIRNNAKAIFAACLNLIRAVLDAFKTLITDFILPLGGDVVRGLIQGVRSMGTAFKDALIGIARGALDGFKRFLGIKSPSTVYSGLGTEIGDGLILGLERTQEAVGNTASNLGTSTMAALKESLSGIPKVLETDVDLHPMIRPVLDASSLTKGLSTVFAKNQTVGVSPVRNQQLALAIAGSAPTALPVDMGRYFGELRDLIGTASEGSQTDISGTITVQVANDKNEIIGIATRTMTDLLRRGAK